VCSLPHTLGTTTTNPGSPITLAIGGTVYLLGLATESMADYQKWTFKSNNPGQFCNVGLWSVSQHPNFFGNLLLWTGILIMNADSLIQIEGGGEDIVSNTLAVLWGSKRFALACLSPLFMWTLFSGQANGSITNAVELAASRYGEDPNYNKYIAAVPQIVPNIFSWLKQLVLGFRGV
jgi:steroid 5-alpha reductase family enzyme